jgi:predicted nucleic acid-binding protein
VLAATARNHDVAALASADRGFADVAGLRHADPGATDAVEALRQL